MSMKEVLSGKRLSSSRKVKVTALGEQGSDKKPFRRRTPSKVSHYEDSAKLIRDGDKRTFGNARKAGSEIHK